MGYSLESKIRAKAYVAEIRSNTYCELCGKQPIEWHHVDHEINGNNRVSHLTSQGHPISRLKIEIEKCQALCRSCHMKIDGRLQSLLEKCPNKLGSRSLPKACIKCGKLEQYLRKGLCNRCNHQRRKQMCDSCADRAERGGDY